MIRKTCNILAKHTQWEYISILDNEYKPIHEIGERPAKPKNIIELCVKNKVWGLLCIEGDL